MEVGPISQKNMKKSNSSTLPLKPNDISLSVHVRFSSAFVKPGISQIPYVDGQTCEALWQMQAKLGKVPWRETCNAKSEWEWFYSIFFSLLIFVNFDRLTIHIFINWYEKMESTYFSSYLKQVVTVGVNRFYFFLIIYLSDNYINVKYE